MAEPTFPRGLPPLSLYVHFPWCLRKCPYCDFNSHTLRDPLPERQYLDALLADLDNQRPAVQGRTLQTVFIGGGTPSLISAAGIERLLGGIRARLATDPDWEVTLEANPGAAERQRFADYRSAGVTRLSLGIQSFADDALRALGRIHDAAQAHSAIHAAKAAGFERLNLDLMFGLPHQTPEQADADLITALNHDPGHLSRYELTLEPNTVFARYPPPRPADDAITAMYEAGRERLAAAGYAHYELSSYAQPGHRCRHNLNYWRFGDYLAIGAGAHGKLSFTDPPRIERYWNEKHPKHYLAQSAHGPPRRHSSRIAAADLPLEFMMNALRLPQGATRDQFQARTGLPIADIAPILRDLRAQGLMDADPATLKTTPRGLLLLNDILQRFVV